MSESKILLKVKHMNGQKLNLKIFHPVFYYLLLEI